MQCLLNIIVMPCFTLMFLRVNVPWRFAVTSCRQPLYGYVCPNAQTLSISAIHQKGLRGGAFLQVSLSGQS